VRRLKTFAERVRDATLILAAHGELMESPFWAVIVAAALVLAQVTAHDVTTRRERAHGVQELRPRGAKRLAIATANGATVWTSAPAGLSHWEWFATHGVLTPPDEYSGPRMSAAIPWQQPPQQVQLHADHLERIRASQLLQQQPWPPQDSTPNLEQAAAQPAPGASGAASAAAAYPALPG
jgi:hypothetical protein